MSPGMSPAACRGMRAAAGAGEGGGDEAGAPGAQRRSTALGCMRVLLLSCCCQCRRAVINRGVKHASQQASKGGLRDSGVHVSDAAPGGGPAATEAPPPARPPAHPPVGPKLHLLHHILQGHQLTYV